ncbi:MULTISPECIES: hypothetical protein [Luteimonas]|uniref:hypothetical protein n=1 Tax=Luteimonas TaxID=83614 RepID=UPI000C7E6140|nr:MULTISPECIES: hypothetical protein [Luteimonas]
MTVSGFGRGLLIAGGLVSLAAVAAALLLIGSPGAQRESRLDAARVRDLARIEALAAQQLRRDGTLPASLDALRGEARRVDPLTGLPYGYAVVDARTLRLCATFATDSGDALRQAEPWMHRDWPHGPGDACFERTIARDADDATGVPAQLQ